MSNKQEKLPFETITIGTQTWSVSNLSLVPTSFNTLGVDYWDAYEGSHGSGDASDEDGFYYTWDAAMNVCPVGWHLPSDDEWKVLEAHLGMSTTEQDEIGWRSTDEDTKLKEGETSDFEAKLAGIRNTDGSFYDRGDYTYLWSSSESGSDAYIRLLHYGVATVQRDISHKAKGFSVRLIKDA